MKIFILIITFLVLTLSSTAYAKDEKCKIFDVGCKLKTFAVDTKDYQKKELNKAKKKRMRKKKQ